MKKLLLMIPLLLLLNGCGGKVIYGEVHSVTPKENYIELTIVGKDDILLADENTMVYSFSDIEEGLLEGKLIRPYITAYDLKWKPDGYYSDRICVESVILPEPYVLKDGTELTIRKDHTHTTYFTPDGIEILWEQDPIGPNNVSVGDLPSLDMLSVQAQDAILAYYENQGLLYDLDAELESAWLDYQASDNKLMFQSHHLSQDICPSAASDNLLWYSIYVTRPVADSLHQQSCTHTVFDRKTGHVVETADLFSCTEKELGRRILEIVSMPDTELSREMEKAFRFEYLDFHSNALDVCFPAGSLIGQSTNHMLGVEYTDLEGFIHPWAIPYSTE